MLKQVESTVKLSLVGSEAVVPESPEEEVPDMSLLTPGNKELMKRRLFIVDLADTLSGEDIMRWVNGDDSAFPPVMPNLEEAVASLRKTYRAEHEMGLQQLAERQRKLITCRSCARHADAMICVYSDELRVFVLRCECGLELTVLGDSDE